MPGRSQRHLRERDGYDSAGDTYYPGPEVAANVASEPAKEPAPKPCEDPAPDQDED